MVREGIRVIKDEPGRTRRVPMSERKQLKGDNKL